MIINKFRIKQLLKNTEEELDREQEGICIVTPVNDFDANSQIGSDSIDLRISNRGYVINSEYKYINTLSDVDFKDQDYFVEINLDLEKGYNLNPGEVLFINTYEKVHLKGDIIGEIMGRSVFSRLGLSVHCTQSKFASGINSIVPLQIKNNVNIPLKIFPYQKLVQLIIHRTEQNKYPYTGQYSNEETYRLPKVSDNDRIQYDKRTREIITSIHPPKNTFKDKYGGKNMKKWTSVSQAIAGALLSIFVSLLGFFGISNITLTVTILSIIVYILFNYYIIKISED